MEMQSESSKPDLTIPKNNKQLSLDDYHFLASNKQIDLTTKKLIQIIGMHGFVKARVTKNVMIEAIQSINLMEPSRSTRDDANVSSNAFMTLEEAISDLDQLNWQECCVTSIQTVNSVNYRLVNDITGAPSAGSKLKLAGKRRRGEAAHGGAGVGSLGCGGSEGSQSVCSSVGLPRPDDGVCAEEDE